MLIIGAKGFAKEVFQVFDELGQVKDISFFDDINKYPNPFLFNTFPIISSTEEALEYFSLYGNLYTIGIGNPQLRHKLYQKFTQLGAELVSTISPHAKIGNFDVSIGKGCNILSNAVVSNSVSIGIGCILYYNSVVTHDCILGDFVEVSPSANILGRCKIGSFTQIGSNATILPDVTVGSNCLVGAGAVVTKNVAAHTVVAGIPATVKRTIVQ